MSAVGKRYGEALLSIAIEQQQILNYKAEFLEIKKVFNPTIMKFFNSPNISKELKKRIIKDSFSGVSEMLMNFLYLLVDKQRLNNLNEIVESYVSLANFVSNIAQGTLYSVRKLEQDEISSLEESLSKKLNKKVILENAIDESLISGVRVEIDQKIYDGSLKHELSQMKDYLILKEGVR